MRNKHIHCPANGWDCPYYKNGLCKMEEMDADVKSVYYECDDFAYFYEEGEDYYCDCEEC